MQKHPIIFTSSATRIVPLIKVVGEACNLKCSYCYYNHKNQTQDNYKRMSLSTLENFIKQYLSIFDGEVVFVWHGGEPLIAGVDFYEHVVDFENKYKKDTHIITNAIQTNGTLINSDWCIFFKKNDFKVSISIDGCPEIHDKYRMNSHGIGSSNKVISSIRLLKEYGVTPSVLQTVTKESLKFIHISF